MQHLRFFHSKSFTLLQQNQSAFTANLLPFYNRTKALSQQIFYHLAKTKGLKQQNKSASTPKPTVLQLLNVK